MPLEIRALSWLASSLCVTCITLALARERYDGRDIDVVTSFHEGRTVVQ